MNKQEPVIFYYSAIVLLSPYLLCTLYYPITMHMKDYEIVISNGTYAVSKYNLVSFEKQRERKFEQEH